MCQNKYRVRPAEVLWPGCGDAEDLDGYISVILMWRGKTTYYLSSGYLEVIMMVWG